MTLRTALPILLSLLLVACGGQDAATPEAAATPAADATPAETIADEPALDPNAAPAAAEPVAEATASEANAATEPAAPLAPATAVPGLVEGRDYEIIPNGQPFEPLNGKIEVIEVFNYVCPACAMFQPVMNTWKARVPADVRVTYVAAPFGGRWDNYVRAYYAAEAMGIADKTHNAMFKALHVDRSLKGERGDDTPTDIARFYAGHGVDAKQFESTMSSFAVNAKFNRARQYVSQSGTNATPTIIVNGRYKAKGSNWDSVMRATDALIAHERASAGK